ARCQLLEQIIAAEGRQWCEVGRDACEACCASSPPGPVDINPVLASLVYDLTGRVVERGGVAGCAPDRAAGLQAWAEMGLAFDPDSAPEASVSAPPRAVTPCCHLGPEVGFRVRAFADGFRRVPVFACRHPGHCETTAEECHTCRDWAERPAPPPQAL